MTSSAQKSHPWVVVALLSTVQFMGVLDFAMVNIALPAMQQALGFSEQNLQWIVSAYSLTWGGFLLLGGRAADILGRRRVFMAGLGLFTIASLIGGLAQFQWVFITARAFQGLGAAIMSPAALSILTTTFGEGHKRNQAMGIWNAFASGGFAAGVLLGGILIDNLGWQWVMFVNVPLGTAVFAFSPIVLSESRAQTTTSQVDIAGAVTVTAGLMLLVYALVQAPEVGWITASTLLLFVGALTFLTLFVWIERQSLSPLIPLGIFRRRTLVAANFVGALLHAVAVSMVFILTLYMQQILNYSALQTGLALLPHALAESVMAPLASQLVNRWGVKTTLVAGMMLVMAGMVILTQISVRDNFIGDLLPGTVIAGLGIVTGLVSVTIAATAGINNSEQGLASGLLSTCEQIGAATGLAIVVAISTARTKAIAANTDSSKVALQIATTEGFQAALAVGAIFAAIGILVTVMVQKKRQQT